MLGSVLIPKPDAFISLSFLRAARESLTREFLGIFEISHGPGSDIALSPHDRIKDKSHPKATVLVPGVRDSPRTNGLYLLHTDLDSDCTLPLPNLPC